MTKIQKGKVYVFFPKKETVFLRLCHPSQISIMDMISLIDEDYPDYMADNLIKMESYEIIGKDIFKMEIEIIDGRSYDFIFSPVRVIDYSDTIS